MADKSPFWCSKVLSGPFQWPKSFSVFSRTVISHTWSIQNNHFSIKFFNEIVLQIPPNFLSQEDHLNELEIAIPQAFIRRDMVSL